PPATVSVPCGASVNELSSDRSRSKIPVERSNKVQIKPDTLDNLLDKKPLKSDLLRLFKDSGVHSKIIGTALDVKVNDLVPLPQFTSDNLILVFERWIDSGNDVTWRNILEVCGDYPDELGKAEADVKVFLSSDRARNNYK
uniref:Death domain-containing protein n=1 Tax=Amphimedon queenslandica TaxID=400682 RepID=A0A1X7TFR9_AMPQE